MLLLVQKLNAVRFDLNDRSSTAIFPMPCPALQFTIDEHSASLSKLRHAAICKFTPCDDPDIADILRPLVARIAITMIRSKAEIDDRDSARRFTDLRILR